MKRFALCVLVAAINAAPAFALEVPSTSRYDHRIRYVTYNPADVVQLDTVLGVATHIELEEGEQYETHVFGDSAAYAFTRKGNHIFLKPKAEQADTNLIVVTDRRSYKFRLQFRPNRAGATYELSFRYPDTQARVSREAREKAEVDAAFLTAPGEANIKYSMSGDLDLAPVNAWDNGRFTFFKFAANADMPAVYLVDRDGNEVLQNPATKGESNNILMVPKVHPRFHIRLGNRVLAIYNEAYDPNGLENTTGTASPGVQRVIKGGR
ncbi:P-type conjugative transfer protein VirB9 [Brucella cytisi]|uniref:P-type conjugative transfer protein VirB9 n=1 Tax=Brucella cytisi TaxID=407152 RepID=A0A1J6HAX7_9HYPH|nr:P-type conjugative transfer protein VirB9 [Brucella cytisi]OIS90253.1 P-type conjugative transfer protein VirB9 [Brucella cytisi]